MNPCRNGGQCIEGQAATICKCRVGFYGTYCQGKYGNIGSMIVDERTECVVVVELIEMSEMYVR